MEIFGVENTVTEIKNSPSGFNSRFRTEKKESVLLKLDQQKLFKLKKRGKQVNEQSFRTH